MLSGVFVYVYCMLSPVSVSWSPIHRSFIEAPVITLLPLLLHSSVPSSPHHYNTSTLHNLSNSLPYFLILTSLLTLIVLPSFISSWHPLQPPLPLL